MEDPISREARRIEIDQMERLIHEGLAKAVRSKYPHAIVQVQYDAMKAWYLATCVVEFGGRRYRSAQMVRDEDIEEKCTSVEQWSRYMRAVIGALLAELFEALPPEARPNKIQAGGGWYEATGRKVSKSGIFDNRSPSDRMADALERNAAQAAEDAKLQKVQENLAIESIKKAMKRS